MSKREQNRNDFPAAALIVDQMQALFGKVRVDYVCEGGKEAGTQLDESQYTVITGKDLIVPPKLKRQRHEE
ncbi:MAG: hypothetical protein ACAH07_05960 [Methylophilaceae bacterium]|nr:hypothetical protein [Methyloradius sp.]